MSGWPCGAGTCWLVAWLQGWCSCIASLVGCLGGWLRGCLGGGGLSEGVNRMTSEAVGRRFFLFSWLLSEGELSLELSVVTIVQLLVC